VAHVTSVVDDLDGGVADETVSFSLDGVDYEIDLSAENAQRLRETLQFWIKAAYPANGTRYRPRGLMQLVLDSGHAPAIREWARGSGFDVPSRGRLPARLVNAYASAHGAPVAHMA
jgi:hypothetical protein